MEERPADMECSCEYVEKQARTSDKGWPSILRVGFVAGYSPP